MYDEMKKLGGMAKKFRDAASVGLAAAVDVMSTHSTGSVPSLGSNEPMRLPIARASSDLKARPILYKVRDLRSDSNTGSCAWEDNIESCIFMPSGATMTDVIRQVSDFENVDASHIHCRAKSSELNANSFNECTIDVNDYSRRISESTSRLEILLLPNESRFMHTLSLTNVDDKGATSMTSASKVSKAPKVQPTQSSFLNSDPSYVTPSRAASSVPAVIESAAELKAKEAAKAAEKAEVGSSGGVLSRKLDAWAFVEGSGNYRDIRALLATLPDVLWPNSGWAPVSLGTMLSSTEADVKKTFRKAIMLCHPDKNRGASVEQEVVADRLFNALNESFKLFGTKT